MGPSGPLLPFDILQHHVLSAVNSPQELARYSLVCKRFDKDIAPILRVVHLFWRLLGPIQSIPRGIWKSDLKAVPIEQKRIPGDETLVKCEDVAAVTELVKTLKLPAIDSLALQVARLFNVNHGPYLGILSLQLLHALTQEQNEEGCSQTLAALEHMIATGVEEQRFRVLFDSLLKAKYSPAFEFGLKTTAINLTFSSLCKTGDERSLRAILDIAIARFPDYSSIGMFSCLFEAQYSPAFIRARAFAKEYCTNQNDKIVENALYFFARLIKADYEPAFQDATDAALRNSKHSTRCRARAALSLLQSLCGANYAPALEGMRRFIGEIEHQDQDTRDAAFDLKDARLFPDIQRAALRCCERSDASIKLYGLKLFATIVDENFRPAFQDAATVAVQNAKDANEEIKKESLLLLTSLVKANFAQVHEAATQAALQNINQYRAITLMKAICTAGYDQALEQTMQVALQNLRSEDRSIKRVGFELLLGLVDAQYTPVFEPAFQAAKQYAGNYKFYVRVGSLLQSLVKARYEKAYDIAIQLALHWNDPEKGTRTLIALFKAVIGVNYPSVSKAALGYAVQNVTNRNRSKSEVALEGFKALINGGYAPAIEAARACAVQHFNGGLDYITSKSIALFNALFDANDTPSFEAAINIALKYADQSKNGKGLICFEIFNSVIQREYTAGYQKVAEGAVKSDVQGIAVPILTMLAAKNHTGCFDLARATCIQYMNEGSAFSQESALELLSILPSIR